MKNLGLILVLIFGLNLFSEIESGDCHEMGEANLQSLPTSYSEQNDHSTNDSHQAEHVHLCHFGHCGHLFLQDNTLISDQPILIPDSLSKFVSPPIRHLSPLYRPPIA